MWEYRATALRAVDGDTIDVLVDLGFHVTLKQRVRLLDVDTPERGEPNWDEAKAFTAGWLVAHPALVLHTLKPDPRDKYGRFIAEVLSPEGVSLNEAIRMSGFLG